VARATAPAPFVALLGDDVDERYKFAERAGPGSAGTLPAEAASISIEPFPGIVQALASVVLAMPFIVAGVPAMLMIWFLFDSRFRGFSRIDVILVAICGFLGFLMVVTFAVIGLIYGITAILVARRHNRSAALGMAGVMLNGFCVLLCVFIVILWALALNSLH
jgi:hypothetical protein